MRDQHLTTTPSTAGEPEAPEPVACIHLTPKDEVGHGSMFDRAYRALRAARSVRGTSLLYLATVDQLRAYGDARAKHARRVAIQGYQQILAATDSEMRDGDLARDIAQQALAAAQQKGDS